MKFDLLKIDENPEAYLPDLNDSSISDLFQGLFYDETNENGINIDDSSYFKGLIKALRAEILLTQSIDSPIYIWVIRYLCHALYTFPEGETPFHPNTLEYELNKRIEKLPFSAILSFCKSLLEIENTGFESRQILEYGIAPYNDEGKGYWVKQEIYIRTEDGLLNFERLKEELILKMKYESIQTLEIVKLDLARLPFQFWSDLLQYKEEHEDDTKSDLNRLINSNYQ